MQPELPDTGSKTTFSTSLLQPPSFMSTAQETRFLQLGKISLRIERFHICFCGGNFSWEAWQTVSRYCTEQHPWSPWTRIFVLKKGNSMGNSMGMRGYSMVVSGNSMFSVCLRSYES